MEPRRTQRAQRRDFLFLRALSVLRGSIFNSVNQRSEENIQDEITYLIFGLASVDAIYLYGSRVRGCARDDCDIAVLFSDYEPDLLERAVRPQMLESQLESAYPEQTISIVEIQAVSVPLQWNVIRV